MAKYLKPGEQIGSLTFNGKSYTENGIFRLYNFTDNQDQPQSFPVDSSIPGFITDSIVKNMIERKYPK